jgi:hypothetical protein
MPRLKHIRRMGAKDAWKKKYLKEFSSRPFRSRRGEASAAVRFLFISNLKSQSAVRIEFRGL